MRMVTWPPWAETGAGVSQLYPERDGPGLFDKQKVIAPIWRLKPGLDPLKPPPHGDQGGVN